MRNLMIGAVSALALMAGTALAQNADVPSKSTTSPTMTAPSTGMSTTSPSTGTVTTAPGATTSPSTGLSTTAPGSSGSSSSTSDTMTPGSSGWSGQTTAPSGLGSATSSSPAADNQRATGTLCPPGTPNCKPDAGSGK